MFHCLFLLPRSSTHLDFCQDVVLPLVRPLGLVVVPPLVDDVVVLLLGGAVDEAPELHLVQHAQQLFYVLHLIGKVSPQ